MNARIKAMEQRHQEALAAIEQFRTHSEPEMRAITEYLLETDANPYSFLPNGWGSALDTSTSFDRFLSVIHHALYDDGDISFPIVNGAPRMAFVWRNEDNYANYVLSDTEKNLQEMYGTEYKIEQCQGVMDWIARHREYQRRMIRRAVEEEFYEDNLVTQNIYLREWFERSLRKTTQ